jgi:hypothetical protein
LIITGTMRKDMTKEVIAAASWTAIIWEKWVKIGNIVIHHELFPQRSIYSRTFPIYKPTPLVKVSEG